MKNLTENLQAWAQLLVALTALGAGLAKLIKDIRDRARSAPPAAAPDVPSQPPARLTSPQRFGDLALALAYAALFSLIGTYALGISGRFLDWHELAAVALVMTLLIGATLVLAWYREKLATAVAGLAVLSFVILVIAPGGAFSGTFSEETPSPRLPLLLLSIAAATYLLYLRARSAPWLVGTRRRWIVPATLTGICLLGTLTLGVDFSRRTSQDEATPNVDSAAARQLFRRIGDLPEAGQGLFYQLASELALVPYYRQQYLAASPGSDGSAISEESMTADEDLEDLSDPYDGFVVSQPQRQASRLRVAVANELLLQAVAKPAPEVYMLNRLSWVHPLGGEHKAAIPVPGRKAEQRLEETAKHRIVKSMSENAALRILLTGSRYSYPPEVRSSVLPDEEEEEGLFGLGDSPRLNPKGLLPAFEPHSANSSLKLQMALPVEEEARVAFGQYRAIALRGSDRSRELIELVGLFEELPPEVQKAFVHYVAGPAELPRYRLLNDFSVFASGLEGDYNPVADVAYLESQLAGLQASQPPVAAAAAVPVESAPEAAEPTSPDDAAVAIDAMDTEEPPSSEEVETLEFAEPSAAVELLAGRIREQLGKVGVQSPALRGELVETLQKLLQGSDAVVPVTDLFRRESLEFAGRIDVQRLDEVELRLLFDICADPVGIVVQRMVQRAPLAAAAGEVDSRGALLAGLNGFEGLAAEDQEAILDLLAHHHYRIERPTNLLALTLANAHTLGFRLDVLLAMALFLPLFLAALFISSYLARTLSARDVLRQSIATEVERGASPLPPFAIAAPVVGRAGLLSQLAKLARKGWSTIALVGQRGVGKTRILQELLMGGTEEWRRPAVGVWITAPARFDEREFIASTLEQVAAQVERTVAHHLGAEPLAARRLEARLKRGGALHFAMLVLLFSLTLAHVEAGLAEPMLVLALTPTFLVLLAAFCAGVVYWTKVQPVDLTTWLQARQAAHSQSVLMYREAMEVLDPRRLARAEAAPSSGAAYVYRRGLLIVLALLTVTCAIAFAAEASFFNGTLFAGLVIVWLGLLARRPAEKRGNRSNLMSLLRTYRDYVASVVRRIELGALGEPARRPGLVICVDELDKIVDLGEVREFVRRIKGIFEVRGVHYYLSLAEDAFGALYLGSVDGKNEIDSSFDHIVRVRPLDVEEATAVVTAHCERLGIDTTQRRLARAVAAVTFGVPRDALRLCDEIATMWEEVAEEGVGVAIRSRREIEARLAYELRRIDFATCGRLGGEAHDCSDVARRFFEAAPGPGEVRAGDAPRVVLSCWLLALVEGALAIEDEALWTEVTAKVCELGAQVVIVRLEDLIGEVRAVDNLIRRGAGAEQAVA